MATTAHPVLRATGLKLRRQIYLLDALQQLQMHLKAGKVRVPLNKENKQLMKDAQFVQDCYCCHGRASVEEIYVMEYDRLTRYSGFSRVKTSKSMGSEFHAVLGRISALLRKKGEEQPVNTPV